MYNRNLLLNLHSTKLGLNMKTDDGIVSPGLFGQKHASRDYTQEKFWGKNQFNSSFPASLIGYMSHKGVKPVYLCIDKNNKILHKYISGEELFGINPLADNLYYNFETNYIPMRSFILAGESI